MDKLYFPLLVTVTFSLIGIVGDYFLKLASDQKHPLTSGWFYIGFALYASTAFGWVFVMRYLKLSTIGAVYSVSMILALTLVGATFFGEKLSTQEILGVILAICSLFLLMRFA
jgi:drug/metabolite transporter (DMT)-like permease